MTCHRKVFTLGPWRDEFGDPADPDTLMGIAVLQRLLERSDRAGALVLLADGRFGLTGRKVAVGPAWQLTGHLRRSRVERRGTRLVRGGDREPGRRAYRVDPSNVDRMDPCPSLS